MKVRTICVCISTALLISVSTSTVFADVSPVSDRSLLISSDTIFWDEYGIEDSPGPDYYGYLTGSTSTPNVITPNGTAVAVSHLIDPSFEIYAEPSSYFRDANFQDGDYLLSTFAYDDWFAGGFGYNSQQNPTTFLFSATNDESICGFGTQIAPRETGEFKAEIQAFDGDGPMGPAIVVTGSDADPNAAFLGISSTQTTPMTSVKVVITSTANGGGDGASWFAINQVTLTYCSDLPVEPPPPVPEVTCEGFAAPMANYPVTAKKNRVFPLKMELFDENGIEQTNVELAAAPVVKVDYTSSLGGAAADLSNLLSTGQGSDGNRFDYTDDGMWQFNLKSKNLAEGTYTVTVVSGDGEEYVIDSTCETQFIIK